MVASCTLTGADLINQHCMNLLQVAHSVTTLASGIKVGGKMVTQADFVPQPAMMGASRYALHGDQTTLMASGIHAMLAATPTLSIHMLPVPACCHWSLNL